MDSADYPEMFYARQVINNACGTQALLSVLLNIKDDGVDLGKTLQNFQEFASALDAETRGKLIRVRGVAILVQIRRKFLDQHFSGPKFLSEKL